LDPDLQWSIFAADISLIMKKHFNLLLSGLFSIFLAQSCSSQTTKNTAWNGKWAVMFASTDIGEVRTFLEFEFGDSTFTAHTRENADKDILGTWKSFLGRRFTSSFAHGSLINITDGKTALRNDTLFLRGIFRCAIGNYYFRGFIKKDSLSVALLNGKFENKGTIRGSRTGSVQLPDYSKITQKAIGIAKENIYSKALLQSKDWKSFEQNIRETSLKMKDDLELVFAFYYYAGKLPVSHFSLLRLPAKDPGGEEDKPSKQISLEEKSPETVYMKITSFAGTREEMDSAFKIIIGKHYRNLIVDLRDNPGGSIEAGMSFATHIADTAYYGGVFLTQKWYVTHSAIPSANDYNKLPVFTESNFDLLIEGIHKQEGLCLRVIPAKDRYKGRLFLLTNGSTASTCEPIIYGLKQLKRATIVGEKTAGAMLNGEFFAIEDGFSVIIPTAEYYASDGYRIDQQGVKPDIEVKEKEALNYVLNTVLKK
jgi:hypothetical protein